MQYRVRGMKSQKILVIVGPTASGKSDLAVRLAEKLRGEVISADSRQVYRGLDIGTGKITRREMRGVRHHLLDVAPPRRVFTAHEYQRLGRIVIEDITTRGKLPIVCGGTGFYIDALLGRITLPDVPANKMLRKKLAEKSASYLFNVLQKLDPRRAQTIDRHNPVRLIRAIEIAKAPPTDISSYRTRSSYAQHLEIIWIGIKPLDAKLRKKIKKRLLARMRAGMVAEVRHLHRAGLSYKRMEALGLEYRHLARYLQKKVGKYDMLAELERDIWRYAKRQVTYWRRNNDIRWFSNANDVLRQFSQSRRSSPS